MSVKAAKKSKVVGAGAAPSSYTTMLILDSSIPITRTKAPLFIDEYRLITLKSTHK